MKSKPQHNLYLDDTRTYDHNGKLIKGYPSIRKIYDYSVIDCYLINPIRHSLGYDNIDTNALHEFVSEMFKSLIFKDVDLPLMYKVN